MTWKQGDVYYTTDTPQRNRINETVYESTSMITVDSNSVETFTCTVTYNAPTDTEYDWIAKNAPEYSASCSIEGEFLQCAEEAYGNQGLNYYR